jgi:hypothetical protein
MRRINRKKFHLETKMELEGLNVLEGSRDKIGLLKGEIKSEKETLNHRLGSSNTTVWRGIQKSISGIHNC